MLKLKEFYEKIPEVFKNKYFIVGFLFLIWISFLDENNLVSLNQQINTLEEKQEIIDSLENEIFQMENKLERLNNDRKELEKFARENFLMKKENEDIILIK
ncbi:MAG: septum formation initiator family protein [Flavobacteriales bacterium]|jgi:cell division protein FtsB|nr:septum formation initiator family protein [Flavobacteriales bacterium]MBT5698419.1 septum formation initiator family protein [Flavobacteriales bacterium]MBT6699560.1 septum formation initiator family protein [Flavobacteriales bacterium]MBT7726366.1 septum formation initiator family protein [Flavobacteriales bacterium]